MTQIKPTDLEDRLVDHVLNTQYGSLPPSIVEQCKLFVLDTIGVGLAAHNAPGCAAVAEVVGNWEIVSGGSTVLLNGSKTAPPLAALANSTLMHALDFDDTLDESALHTFVSILPTALATAESVGKVDGKSFITALVLGVDIICRLSLGISRPLDLDTHIHLRLLRRRRHGGQTSGAGSRRDCRFSGNRLQPDLRQLTGADRGATGETDAARLCGSLRRHVGISCRGRHYRKPSIPDRLLWVLQPLRTGGLQSRTNCGSTR